MQTARPRKRFTEIRTGRLTLRDLEVSDARRILAYRSQAEVSRFQSWGTQSVDEICSYINSLSAIEPGQPGPWYQIAITLLSNRELIGDCGYRILETEPRQAEFGITVDPAYQSQGYATEALHALLTYLFHTLGKHRVFGSVDPRNMGPSN